MMKTWSLCLLYLLNVFLMINLTVEDVSTFSTVEDLGSSLKMKLGVVTLVVDELLNYAQSRLTTKL